MAQFSTPEQANEPTIKAPDSSRAVVVVHVDDRWTVYFEQCVPNADGSVRRSGTVMRWYHQPHFRWTSDSGVNDGRPSYEILPPTPGYVEAGGPTVMLDDIPETTKHAVELLRHAGPIGGPNLDGRL